MKRGFVGWTLAILMVVVGVCAVYSAHQWLAGVWVHVLAEFGIALMVAGLLGITVDLFVKRQISKDAVEAALGYVLPPPLRDEMQWIYDQKFICERHHATLKLDLHDGWVLVRQRFDRTFQNVSSADQDLEISLSVDEWGHPTRPSKISRCGYQQGGTSREYTAAELGVHNPNPHAMAIDVQRITLRPKERATVWAEWEELRATNDAVVAVFKHPTLNPHVEVYADESIDFETGFGHRMKHSARRLGANAWELEGLLLPNQHIRVRWWPKP